MFSRSSLLKTSLLLSAFASSDAALSLSSSSNSSSACGAISSSLAASSVAPISQLTCAVVVTNDWSSGYQVDVKVGNAGTTATDKWTVILDVPADQILNSVWNASKLSQTGNSYSYGNLSWNGSLQPNASTSFGATLNRSAGGSSVVTCRVESGQVNRAPTADFTAAVTNDTVHVQSINGVDADGDALVYTIDFGDGQSLVYPDVWHSYKTPGTYTIKQTVSDGKTSTSISHDVVVTAAGANRAPVAIYSYFTNGYQVGANAKASVDLDGSALSYSWDFGSGASALGNAVSTTGYVYKTGGAYVTLTVFDGQLGNTLQYKVYTSACSHSDPAPVIKFASSVNGMTLSLDATATTNADGFNWDFGDGTTGTGIYATHTYSAAGTYVVSLRATAQMMSTTQTTTITINPVVNLPPVLQYSCSGYIQYQDDFVNHISTQSFDAWCDFNGSSDPEGKPLSYYVNWNDTNSGQSSSVSSSTGTTSYYHHYSSLQSSYNITVAVSDGVNQVSKSLRLSQGGTVETNSAPIACFEMTGTSALSTNAGCSSDADGDSLSYSWNFGDGTSATGVSATHSYTASGSYLVTLTVSDSKTQSVTTKTFVYTAVVKTTSCKFNITNQWASGYNGVFVIKNEGTAPVSNWEALLTFPDNETISTKFNGTFEGTNPITVKPPVWAITLQPGASQEVGFQVWKKDASLPAKGPIVAGPSCQ